METNYQLKEKVNSLGFDLKLARESSEHYQDCFKHTKDIAEFLLSKCKKKDEEIQILEGKLDDAQTKFSDEIRKLGLTTEEINSVREDLQKFFKFAHKIMPEIDMNIKEREIDKEMEEMRERTKKLYPVLA